MLGAGGLSICPWVLMEPSHEFIKVKNSKSLRIRLLLVTWRDE
jgi:hypothetical protein